MRVLLFLPLKWGNYLVRIRSLLISSFCFDILGNTQEVQMTPSPEKSNLLNISLPPDVFNDIYGDHGGSIDFDSQETILPDSQPALESQNGSWKKERSCELKICTSNLPRHYYSVRIRSSAQQLRKEP